MTRRALPAGLLALLLAAPAAAADPAPDDAPLRFELCGEIASVEVGRFDGAEPWRVLIQLRSEAGRRFERTTAENAGRALEITHGGHVLLRARIGGAIRSGLVTAAYAEREDAERARATLRDPSVCAAAGAPDAS